MITILFNTDTNKPISGYMADGYKVDGQPQAVELPIVELEIITTARPEITDTQRISDEWTPDFVLKQYVHVWTIEDMTEAEILAEQEATQAALEASPEYKIQILEGVVEELILILNDKGIAP